MGLGAKQGKPRRGLHGAPAGRTPRPREVRSRAGAGGPLLTLQRTVGNRAVGSLVGAGPQAAASPRSLRDLAHRGPDPALAEEREAEALARRALEGPDRPRAARAPAHGAPRTSLRAAGASLPAALRTSMEARFGSDFSDVRIHEDGASARLARAAGSRAFTLGSDIVFGRGEYRPERPGGEALLAHELAHVLQQRARGQPRLQRARLRDWESDRAAVVADADIETTNEFQSYMNPASTWQTVHAVTREEAIQACRYILADLRNGVSLSWADAGAYLTRARDYLNLITRLAADQEAFLTTQGAAGGRSVGEQIHHMAQTGGYGGGTATWWNGLAPADQATWMTDAAAVIARVEASVVGTDLEQLVAARGIVADPQRVEELSSYAFRSSSTNSLHVGRDWIRRADADPLDVHDNIAHELGGHFEYTQWGDRMGDAILDAVLANIGPVEAALANAGPRSVYSAFAYMETEIFAELREYDLRRPGSGGDSPTTDIPRQLTNIRDRFALSVARAIVTELDRRVQGTSNISTAAKTFFAGEISTVFSGWTP